MRLAEIEIRNFKGLGNITITIPALDPSRPGSANFVSIIGRNNVGKSSILQAICLASPHVPPTAPNEDHFPHRSLSRGPIEVTLTFDNLTETDQQEHAIRAHIHEGRYRVRKRWHLDEDENKIVRAIEAYAPTETLDLPKDITWAQLLQHSAATIALAEEYKRRHDKPPRNKLSPKVIDALKDIAREINSPLRQPNLEWSTNPGGISPNVDKVFPRVIFLPAQTETKSAISSGIKDSALYQIADAMFTDELSKHKAVRTFKAAADSLTHLFSDLGKHRIVGNLESEISSRLGRFIDLTAELDLRAPDVTADLAKMTSIWVKDGVLRTSPEHQGHGAQRALVLSLLHLLAEKKRHSQDASQAILLLVEEPEAYLHPQMCRKMRDVLVDIARNSVAQVICTTHSPVFLDLADRHDGIVLLRKAEGEAQALQRKEDLFGGASEQRERLRMLLNFDPTVNEVFFTGGQAVCLFEGDTELVALDAIAERLETLSRLDRQKYLTARRDVTTVNCRGKWTIRAFQRVLNNFNIGYRVVHDRDRETAAEGANSKILELASDPSRVHIHCENIEEAFFGAPLKSDRDKPWQIRKNIQAMSEADLTSPSSALRKFFEFVLGCKLESLAPNIQAQAIDSPIEQDTTSSTLFSQRARRNHRERIATVSASSLKFHQSEQLSVLLPTSRQGLRVPQLERQAIRVVHTVLGDLLAVRIADESMRDTLAPADVVLLKPMDFLLPCYRPDASIMSLASFKQSVDNEDIVLAAVNEDIADGHYDLRRVTLRDHGKHGSERWSLRLHADNPETRWGDRGTMLIYKEDAVRFLGKVVGRLPEEDGDALRRRPAEALIAAALRLPEKPFVVEPPNPLQQIDATNVIPKT
ncbi:AAA family ATPase [Pyxidicoccus fallax]|uniref:AAA family ATPase n=1 Tax=Pyxidicoccus fallax TaxID=394095 RepID=A0A848LFQ9_9BACT|nr:AAA family ATPase [Pyxidicoccus fallax]NPC79400.1 AAA family ATPase [Pyxidicoccus fallax]